MVVNAAEDTSISYTIAAAYDSTATFVAAAIVEDIDASCPVAAAEVSSRTCFVDPTQAPSSNQIAATVSSAADSFLLQPRKGSHALSTAAWPSSGTAEIAVNVACITEVAWTDTTTEVVTVPSGDPSGIMAAARVEDSIATMAALPQA